MTDGTLYTDTTIEFSSCCTVCGHAIGTTESAVGSLTGEKAHKEVVIETTYGWPYLPLTPKVREKDSSSFIGYP